MPGPAREEIRLILLAALAGGGPISRAALLHAVAARCGVDPCRRSLRALVAGELRRLEDDGELIDGGPEVWLRDP